MNVLGVHRIAKLFSFGHFFQLTHPISQNVRDRHANNTVNDLVDLVFHEGDGLSDAFDGASSAIDADRAIMDARQAGGGVPPRIQFAPVKEQLRALVESLVRTAVTYGGAVTVQDVPFPLVAQVPGEWGVRSSYFNPRGARDRQQGAPDEEEGAPDGQEGARNPVPLRDYAFVAVLNGPNVNVFPSNVFVGATRPQEEHGGTRAMATTTLYGRINLHIDRAENVADRPSVAGTWSVLFHEGFRPRNMEIYFPLITLKATNFGWPRVMENPWAMVLAREALAGARAVTHNLIRLRGNEEWHRFVPVNANERVEGVAMLSDLVRYVWDNVPAAERADVWAQVPARDRADDVEQAVRHVLDHFQGVGGARWPEPMRHLCRVLVNLAAIGIVAPPHGSPVPDAA